MNHHNYPRIPKTHPLLEHAQLAMLRDCRQFVARKLRRERAKCRLSRKTEAAIRQTGNSEAGLSDSTGPEIAASGAVSKTTSSTLLPALK